MSLIERTPNEVLEPTRRERRAAQLSVMSCRRERDNVIAGRIFK